MKREQPATGSIQRKIIVAIDGYSSCGKSTMARALASTVGYVYIDSGAMYRAVTLLALRNNLICDGKINLEQLSGLLPPATIDFRYDPASLCQATYLDGENVEDTIRGIEVSNNVSLIAAVPFVREQLVEQQRKLGRDKGIVMDGRDIGTTVFPHAELKIFVTATAEVRARRRFDELKSNGLEPSFESILANVRERDYIDSHREVSPLRKADDAILLDNTNLTPEAQLNILLQLLRERTSVNM